MHPCERVDLDFIDNAPSVFRNSVDLAITPEQLFEVLADAESWPRWAPVITKVTWTSPEPRGVGTTRTVKMRGGIVGNEEFIAWEPFSHMAFRFNECSTRYTGGVRRRLPGRGHPGWLPADLDDGAETRGPGPAWRWSFSGRCSTSACAGFCVTCAATPTPASPRPSSARLSRPT